MNPAHEHQVNKTTIQMVQISIRYFIMYHLICINMTGKSRNKINLHFQSFNGDISIDLTFISITYQSVEKLIRFN